MNRSCFRVDISHGQAPFGDVDFCQRKNCFCRCKNPAGSQGRTGDYLSYFEEFPEELEMFTVFIYCVQCA